jgi:hypothetical protein
MEPYFTSPELQNAKEVFSGTQVAPQKADTESLKYGLKVAVLSKDPSLVRFFDFGFLNNSETISGITTTKDLIRIIRDETCNKYRDNNEKSLAIRKLFDNISNSLDCLSAIGADLNAEQVKSLVTGYILRNFI